MNLRKTLVATMALAALALAALPAAAGAYEIDLPENPEFTGSAGEVKMTTPDQAVSCESASGSGKFETSQTASGKILFHGCKAAGTACTSSGQSAGTIETTTVLGHVATVTIAGEPAPGGVTTPHEGHFATFECVFGLVKVEVVGNGLVGELTSPAVGEASNSATGVRETENGEQVLTEADIGNGVEVFELEVIVNGTREPAGIDEEETASFVEGQEGTLTE